MSRDDLHFKLRIPARLKAKIARAATDNGRSMKEEIVARLKSTFPDPLLEECTRELVPGFRLYIGKPKRGKR